MDRLGSDHDSWISRGHANLLPRDEFVKLNITLSVALQYQIVLRGWFYSQPSSVAVVAIFLCKLSFSGPLTVPDSRRSSSLDMASSSLRPESSKVSTSRNAVVKSRASLDDIFLEVEALIFFSSLSLLDIRARGFRSLERSFGLFGAGLSSSIMLRKIAIQEPS